MDLLFIGYHSCTIHSTREMFPSKWMPRVSSFLALTVFIGVIELGLSTKKTDDKTKSSGWPGLLKCFGKCGTSKDSTSDAVEEEQQTTDHNQPPPTPQILLPSFETGSTSSAPQPTGNNEASSSSDLRLQAIFDTSVVFESKGQHLCTGAQRPSMEAPAATNNARALLALTPNILSGDMTMKSALLMPRQCLKKFDSSGGDVQAKNGGGEIQYDIKNPFNHFGSGGIVAAELTQLPKTVISLVDKYPAVGAFATAAYVQNGMVAMTRVRVVENVDCKFKYINVLYFCVVKEGGGVYDASLGSPIYIEKDGQLLLAGLHAAVKQMRQNPVFSSHAHPYFFP